MAKRLVWTPLTPDRLSWLGLGLGVAAGVLFAIGGRPAVDGGAVLFILATLLDELDGALARYVGRVTRFGYLLDYVAGTISFCAFFIGAGIGARHQIGLWGLALGLAAATAALFAMRLRMGMEDRHGHAAVRHPRLGPFELKDGTYLIGPAAWAGLFDWFFVAAAVGVCAFALWTQWQRRLWLKGVKH